VVALWIFRLAWLVAGAFAPWSAWNGASDAVRTTAAAWGWVAWAAVMLASAVTLPVSLTVVRLVAPVTVVVSVGAWLAGVGDDAVRAAVGTALVVIGAMAGGGADVATAMVGGGAYGNEVRVPLRIPVPHVAPAVVSWLVCCATGLGGSLLVAAGRTVVGALLCAIAVALLAVVPRRLHGLSRRWLVRVPAGVVVHDHLVLAETLMIRRHDVAAVDLQRSPGAEADLTGGVFGRRLVIALSRPANVTLGAVTTRIFGAGPALHVSAFAVAPLRPLDAARLVDPNRR
jgi:hypothetical protein